jgi:hypothetical protein
MRKIFLIPLLFFSLFSIAQNDRITDHNNTNWMQVFNTIRINKNWSLHAEYQWRREAGLKNWQQSLFRIGVNRKLNDHVMVQLGYGWIETFPYGDFPIASAGTFPEHRVYEQISFRQPFKKFILNHRFRIEQRWMGRLQAGTGRKVEEWVFLHRFRYQFKTQFSISEKWYLIAADEIFIGAGKNLGINIFDQNRIFLSLGYKLNPAVSIETGYFNQTLLQGKRINNNSIVQGNNGFAAALYLYF